MEILFGFMVLLGCLVIGVRYGGLGLAAVSGIGLIIFMFLFGYKPGKAPVDVMLTIMAVVTCAGFLQSSGGLAVMLMYAERFLRSKPKYVTVLAPVTTWFLTILCGTGHVVYTMFPIIYDIAIKQGIRPERPMAVASVASQMGICASPASVAVVSMVAFMSNVGATYGVVQILSVAIPATFLGVVAAALWSMRRGKDLELDEEFQAKIADPKQRAYIYGEAETLVNKTLPRTAYSATLIFLAGIAAIAIFGSFPSLVPHFPSAAGKPSAPVSMTVMIQMLMLLIAGLMLLICKVNAKDVGSSSVFRAGMVAVVSVYGVAWMSDAFFSNHMALLKSALGETVTHYPWAYALVIWLTSKLVNSQAAAISIIVPMALSVGVEPIIVVSFISACYGYFIIPTYPSDLACVGFDRSGTTRIGKYVIDHSFIVPGLIGTFTGSCAGYVIAHAIL